MKIERNLNYDLVRLMGVLIIIIAHSSPPDWLFQLRNFGTPLLIVGSALTYALIYAKREIKVKEFYQKRLSRLILPAWIFLTFFFLLFFVVSELTGKDYPFSLSKILGSYTFMGGIGFVWILKVYIILALFTPVAVYLNKRVANNAIYFGALIFLYICYELAVAIVDPYTSGVLKRIFNSVIFIVVPYVLLYLYGFRLARLQHSYVALLIFISFTIFASMFIYKYLDAGAPVPTQNFKYPPTLYYLYYAFFALNVVYLFCCKINLGDPLLKQVIAWLSSNSLWIYLWHIMAFYIWKFLFPELNGEIIWFLLKAGFLLGFGVLFAALQNKIVGMLVGVDFPFINRIAPMLSTSN